MTIDELLPEVKNSLGITGDYQNAVLKTYISEVIEFLFDAGVKESVLDSPCIIGVVARGVSDLWNYGSGSAALSPYFMQRVTQLVFKTEDDTTITTDTTN